MARIGSGRPDGNCAGELAGLMSELVLMLLTAVYMRARGDARENRHARRFVGTVKAKCRDLDDPGYAALMVMQGKTVAHALGISAAFQDAGPQ